MGRRHLTTTATMLVLCGILVIGAVWGWNSLFAEIPETAPTRTAPSCATELIKAGQRLRSSDVRVSVFNGGTKVGLADLTMESLTARGFLRGEVGNAPSDVSVRRVQVWSTKKNDPLAELVAKQFGKRRVRFSDRNLGPGVDVVVGTRFDGSLVRAKPFLRLSESQQVCLPTPGAKPTTNAAAEARP